MKKLISSLIFILVISVPVLAQNSEDALRFSRVLYGGTARFQGLGGAFGSVGADFSVLATNPAGIGLYRGSELTLTPSVWISSNSSLYNGVGVKENVGNFAMGNAGVVFAIKAPNASKSGGFKYFNFGFGVNRQNDFNSETNMMGPNFSSSMMTEWSDILNNQFLTPSEVDEKYPFDIGLARQAELIYLYDSINRLYNNDAYYGGVYQQKYVTTWGSMNEMEFSWGANYNDLIYFGATLGVPFIRYYQANQYWEDKIDSIPIPYFRSLNYNQYIETHGTGINFKAGVIIRPANWVRIGASIHTPTYYGNMRDDWSSSMFASFDSIDYPDKPTSYNVFNEAYSKLGSNNYNLTTPFRFMGSVAFIFGKFGLFSVEYEGVNYNQARLSSDVSSYEFTGVNEEIQNKYTMPLNIRCGTEWTIKDFRVRGGFSYSGSPYDYSPDNTGERYTASGGVGYRGKKFFGDLTYVWSKMNQDYYFYDSNLVNPSRNNLISHSIVATLGIRF